jgi:hypothetical protein
MSRLPRLAASFIRHRILCTVADIFYGRAARGRDHQFVWTLPAALKSLAGLYPESCRFLMCIS